MQINLGRGLWRLWLFFVLIWVSVCGWNVWDAHAQVQKAESLLDYYQKSSLQAKQLEGGAGVPALVSAHLSEQVSLNEKTIAEQKVRSDKFFYWGWLVPVVALVFVRGLPWVVSGFAK